MKFIEREHINLEIWDAKIAESNIENIFCYSWYLDACAKNWGAVITDDYNTIVPIVYNNKLGVKQMYQAQFTREIDIFGDEFNWKEVLEFLSKDFKAIQFRNSADNILQENEERKNQWLSLAGEFKFSTNAKRLIKKADKQFEYRSEKDPKQLLALFRSTAFQKIDSINENDLERLKKLMESSIAMKQGDLICVYENEEFVGAGFFLLDKKRVTYLKSASTEKAKKEGAMYGLINHAITKFKGDFNILDFGGSDIESVANFYKKFGSSDRSYYNYTINNLPLWFKTLKRIKG